VKWNGGGEEVKLEKASTGGGKERLESGDVKENENV